MYRNEQGYLNLLKLVKETGVRSEDRTGIGTLSIFGAQIRYDLKEGFPLFTTKRVPFKSVASELLWFLEGSSNERRLAEILYDKDRSDLEDKTTIWTANAKAPYWENNKESEGDLGRIYSVQWRRWKSSYGLVVDQIANLIEGLKTDPYSRRHILQSWNPAEVHLAALPPCHVMAQFYVRNNELSCMYTMRSNDLFLGHPFNTASYALLTHMLAHICGLEVGEVIYSGGDVHLYTNHLEQVEEQLSRMVNPAPQLVITDLYEDIESFTMKSFDVINYYPHSPIAADMAV